MQKKLEQDKQEMEAQKHQVQALLTLTLEALSKVKTTEPIAATARKVPTKVAATKVAPTKVAPPKKPVREESDAATRALLGGTPMSEASESEEYESEEFSESEEPEEFEESEESDESEEEVAEEAKEKEDNSANAKRYAELEELNPNKDVKLFVRNVPLTVTEAELDAFVHEGTKLKPKKVWNVVDRDGKFFGRSFVEMRDWKDAVVALQFFTNKVPNLYGKFTQTRKALARKVAGCQIRCRETQGIK